MATNGKMVVMVTLLGCATWTEAKEWSIEQTFAQLASSETPSYI